MSENLIKINEINEDMGNIEIKGYLSFGIKKVMLEEILSSVKSENNQGLVVIDYSLLHFMKNLSLINNYTNIDFSEVQSITEAYDQLCKKGVLEFVLNKINKSELEFFDEILNQEINQIHTIENSVSGVVAKSLNKIIEKLPTDKQLSKLIKDLPKNINKIDPDKLSFLRDSIAFNKGIDLSKGDK